MFTPLALMLMTKQFPWVIDEVEHVVACLGLLMNFLCLEYEDNQYIGQYRG